MNIIRQAIEENIKSYVTIKAKTGDDCAKHDERLGTKLSSIRQIMGHRTVLDKYISTNGITNVIQINKEELLTWIKDESFRQMWLLTHLHPIDLPRGDQIDIFINYVVKLQQAENNKNGMSDFLAQMDLIEHPITKQ